MSQVLYNYYHTYNPEEQYLHLMQELLQRGSRKSTRNGTTLSKFGHVLHIPLYTWQGGAEGQMEMARLLPLLTTKSVPFRLVAEELLLFLRGQTDTKILHEKNVKIWDANTSRETLDKLGFPQREEGDAGPIYGFQWRHFNAPYTHAHADYTGQGVDQIAQLLHGLRTEPFSRRHIVSAWNPVQIPEMVLPPCHMDMQFDVAPHNFDPTKPGFLRCLMHQRSADVPLGLPFNMVSYALLTHLLAHMLDLIPDYLQIVIGDAHIYENQIAGCQLQLSREPQKDVYATLEIKNKHERIEDYTMKDLEVHNYHPQPTINFPFST